MLVRDRMTTDVITISPETMFDHALRLMRERRVRRFPVVSANARVVGIVSEKDLLNASPSPATTLDRYEISTLLSRIKVRDVMTRGVINATLDLPLEEAARIMADNKIGGLPVVNDQHELVGIITETDIFRTMVELMGARRRGLRISFRVEDQRGVLAQFASEITRQGGNIISIVVFGGDDQVHPMITTRVEFVDEDRLVALLRSKGAEILDVRRV